MTINAVPTTDATLVPSEGAAQGFAHVNTWIFDLDNTLYTAESKLWPQVDARITLFLGDYFGLDGLSSRALQKYYYMRYGTTLKGLIDEHEMDPKAFLDFAHDIDLSLLDPNPALGFAIEALPGRKLILTNGSWNHAHKIATKLGIRDHFEEIFDIVAADFTPKPQAATYERFLEKHHVDPKRSAMFEDIAKNLIVPDALGMQTVLVLPDSFDPSRDAHEQVAVDAPYVHYSTTDLTAFLRGVGPVAAEQGQR